MRREEIYEIWVPPDGVWSLWARPILFAQMSSDDLPEFAMPQPPGIVVAWAPGVADGAALVIDLPGEESVVTGLALAGRGYRPVPLYNACTGRAEVIDQGPIVAVLRAGAAYLASLSLATDAPPAFLLDAHRMSPSREVKPGVFDNRWKVFPQDFPSASFLTARGFTRAVLVQRGRSQPQEDLAHVLCRWQDAGLLIEAKDVAQSGPPGPVAVDRPTWYRAAWYRVWAMLGLRRCSEGGFGARYPEATHG